MRGRTHRGEVAFERGNAEAGLVRVGVGVAGSLGRHGGGGGGLGRGGLELAHPRPQRLALGAVGLFRRLPLLQLRVRAHLCKPYHTVAFLENPGGGSGGGRRWRRQESPP